MSSSEREGASLPPDLRARVLASIAQTPAKTRREHQVFGAIVAGAFAFATAVLFFAMGGFERGARPTELVVFTAGCGLAAAVVLTRTSVVGASRSMLGPPRHILILGASAAALGLALVVAMAAALWPEAAVEQVSPTIDVGCGLFTLVQGALPLAAFLVSRRRTDPLHPAVTGAALGMTAGAWAVVMASLRCPHAAALHGIVSHVLPTLLLAAAGALLGRALLKIR